MLLNCTFEKKQVRGNRRWVTGREVKARRERVFSHILIYACSRALWRRQA